MRWYLVPPLVIVVGYAAWVVLRRGLRADPTRQIDALVVEVLGNEWADRLGVAPAAVRAAVLDGTDPSLVARLRAELDRVLIDYRRVAGVAGQVSATLRCGYQGSAAVVEGQTTLAWELVPEPVRAEFIRSGRDRIGCDWVLPAAGTPAGRPPAAR